MVVIVKVPQTARLSSAEEPRVPEKILDWACLHTPKGLCFVFLVSVDMCTAVVTGELKVSLESGTLGYLYDSLVETWCSFEFDSQQVKALGFLRGINF